ncbi:CPCC family cysteine-rich protein [Caldifermentibacillus hisashii]|uniref:CPCC family cysteine-rich protein n=1 Tax=Caldifermentibacillus hisashii TaxID=996558 RepID=UPI0038578E9A
MNLTGKFYQLWISRNCIILPKIDKFTPHSWVCGQKVEIFDICDHCGWQNSGPGEKESDSQGPNKITLKAAKEAYKKIKNW